MYKLCVKMYIFLLLDIFAVKVEVEGSDVNPGIWKEIFIETDSWVDVSSVNFNSKNVYEDEICSRQDLRYYNFSQENPKSSNVQNPHRQYRPFKQL